MRIWHLIAALNAKGPPFHHWDIWLEPRAKYVEADDNTIYYSDWRFSAVYGAETDRLVITLCADDVSNMTDERIVEHVWECACNEAGKRTRESVTL